MPQVNPDRFFTKIRQEAAVKCLEQISPQVYNQVSGGTNMSKEFLGLYAAEDNMYEFIGESNGDSD